MPQTDILCSALSNVLDNFLTSVHKTDVNNHLFIANQIQAGQDWAVQKFLKDNPDCKPEDVEIVNLENNEFGYYIKKANRIDNNAEEEQDQKPWEYVTNSSIFWVGDQNSFLNWMDLNRPKSRMVNSFRSPDILKDLKLDNIYYRVHNDLQLRGIQPQMILIDCDKHLNEEKHLELKAQSAFVHQVFLEDYD